MLDILSRQLALSDLLADVERVTSSMKQFGLFCRDLVLFFKL